MPKGGKRRALQTRRTSHVDKYARLAERSQEERARFDADWERTHPPAPADQPATTEGSEGEEEVA